MGYSLPDNHSRTRHSHLSQCRLLILGILVLLHFGKNGRTPANLRFLFFFIDFVFLWLFWDNCKKIHYNKDFKTVLYDFLSRNCSIVIVPDSKIGKSCVIVS